MKVEITLLTFSVINSIIIRKGWDKMAVFCLDCWNRLNGFQKTERDYVLSDDYDLCEGCGQFRPVIVFARKAKWLYDLKQTLKRRQY